MRCAVTRILLLLVVLAGLMTAAHASVRVKGYFRKDGTYVSPHYRSNPDSNFHNNWSTKGNINPYTGKEGTKVTPPSDFGFGWGSFGIGSKTATPPAGETRSFELPDLTPSTAPSIGKPHYSFPSSNRNSFSDLPSTPPPSNSAPSASFEELYAQRLKQSWGVSVDPATTSFTRMLDIDMRYRLSQEVQVLYGVNVDPRTTPVERLQDIRRRYSIAKRLRDEFPWLKVDPVYATVDGWHGRITAATTGVYAAPSYASMKKLEVAKGQGVVILGTTQQGDWCSILMVGGSVGYVLAEDVVVPGHLARANY